MTAQHAPVHMVIATHGRPALLGRTIESFAAMRRPSTFARLWVVENGSDAGARDVCKQYPHLPLHYVNRAQPGRSRAMQWAVDQIGEGLVIFSDDDVRFGEAWLEAYATAAVAHGPHTFFGGPLRIDYQHDPPPPWLTQYLPHSAIGWEHDTAAPIDKPSFLGANFAVFAQDARALGGFRADLGVGSDGNALGEEMDMQQRMLDADFDAVYLPDAQLWHFVPADRCSPAWALGRIERTWYTNGLTSDEHLPGARIAGAPRWMWRRLITLALRAAIAGVTSTGEKRFEKRKAFRQYKGYVRGIRRRDACKHNPTPTIEAAHG